MNDQREKFLLALDALDKQKVQYILVGGVAVILHSIERLTRDTRSDIIRRSNR